MKKEKDSKVSNIKIYNLEEYSIEHLLKKKWELQKEKRSAQYIAALGFGTTGLYGGTDMIINGIFDRDMSKSTAIFIIATALVGLYGTISAQKLNEPIEEVNNKILNYNKFKTKK